MQLLILGFMSVIGFEHLNVDPVAHRVGMGYGRFGDGYSIYYNPAGLALAGGPRYSASYLYYIGDTHFGYAGYENNQLGAALKYFNGGRIKKTDEYGHEYGSFGVNYIDLYVGKGLFIGNIGVGAAIKGVYTSIDTLYSIGLGVDIGLLYFLEDPDLQFGLVVRNIGSGIKPYIEQSEIFPYEIGIGANKIFDFGWLGFDLVKPALSDLGLRVGWGYYLVDNLELKFSYNSILSSIRSGNNGLDFLAGVTAGVAVKVRALTIDYNFSPYFDLGGCHRLSISIGG